VLFVEKLKLFLESKGIFIRFIVAGGTAAFVNLLILYIAADILGIWYLVASIFAFSTAVIVSFLLQKYFAFRDGRQEQSRKQFVYFLLVTLVNIVLNTTLVYQEIKQDTLIEII
jgi:putative flippase GtrA